MPTVTTGTLEKMAVRDTSPLQYELVIGEQSIPLNPLIGQRITLSFSGNIYCLHCGKKTKKSYGQGYCYDHFATLAQNDSCMMSPEKCHWDQGTCREPDFGERVCNQTHYVYLANASGIKVGITRGTQIPTRWHDQGAKQGMLIARVATRKLAGELETLFKSAVADKTNWRKLVKGDTELVDLNAEYKRLTGEIDEALTNFVGNNKGRVEMIAHADVHQFDFPIQAYPDVTQSLAADKNPEISGRLLGIKGQYLLLDCGVINIRRHGGYELHFVHQEGA